ncbi:hypothetical protein EGJ12_08155 [Stutzerimonas stutzeri]|uniref:DUF7940 domain-containing protein n=1 Tax=Stutzerimonas stutzeri TaxID=316 RepID=UPI000F78BD98|nr:hypothetical protein [Stutzerimonas stutzeri]RRV38635.1 hypothetical protein EGJ12_07805 [Stutzerimonas stutzeri]RRV38698.1 hypothetical protein EGJ12_08155 [Stutzerimonas stutzeri]
MNLIPEWRKSWRLTSVQLAILTAVLNAAAGAWVAFEGHINPVAWASVNMVLGVAMAIARVVSQPKVTGEPK